VQRIPILVICRLPENVAHELAETLDVSTLLFDGAPDPVQLGAALQGKRAVLTSIGNALSAKAIGAFPECVRAIATYSVGYDHIDVEAARTRGIAVFNTPDVLAPSVAEAALFLMLGSARRATESIALLRGRGWTGWTAQQLNGIELSGKRLGILGMGRIGREIAARARGINLKIHYCNRRRLSPDAELGAVFHADPDEMLGAVDLLVLACPSTPTTRGFLNSARIAKLPQGAIVINVGRGDLVVDDALVAALASGHLFAAGLDVFNNEPKIDERSCCRISAARPTKHAFAWAVR